MALTARVDPIRNFKFNVQAILTGEADPFADFGFMKRSSSPLPEAAGSP